jgi:hypothetical protein
MVPDPIRFVRLHGLACGVLATGLASCIAAHAAEAPAFDVAYRAWDAVTDVARHNRDPALGGECGRTFRPFVIPGLKRQTKEEQDAAASACVAAARALCGNAKLQRTGEMAKKCAEFR